MFSIHEHLKKKRAPIDKWTIKEQLCLASAVVRSGDQNWTSVSRALKAFQDPNRPSDWCSQKNCAAQYGLLLDNVDTPKRKKRLTDKFSHSPEIVTETESTLELIKKKLTEERIQELHTKLQQNKREYQKVVQDMKVIRSGKVTLEKVKQIYNAIQERKRAEEKKNLEHVVWLKEREEKKLEMERQLRPGLKLSNTVSSPSNLKFKEEEMRDDVSVPETAKPTTSPLLTSLLKSPSPAPNPSLLHSSIAGRALPKGNLFTSSLSQDNENVVQNISPQQSVLPTIIENKNSTSTVKQSLIDFKVSVADNNSQQESDISAIPGTSGPKIVDDNADNIPDDILSLAIPFGSNQPAGIVNKEIFDDLSMDETLTEVDNIIRKEQEKEQLALQLAQQGGSSSAMITSNAVDIESNSTNSENGTELSESEQIESRVEDIIQSISNDDELLDAAEEETKESAASMDMESIEPEVSNDDMKVDSSDETVIESKSSRENESAPGSVEVVEVVLMEDEEEDGKKVSEDKKNFEMSQMVSDLRKECGLDKSIDERDEEDEEDEKELEENVINETNETMDEKSQSDVEHIASENKETEETVSADQDELELSESVTEQRPEKKIECEPKIVLEKIDSVDIQSSVATERKLSYSEEQKLEDVCEASQIDTDDDSPIEVIKEDKHGKMKRDYSRRRMEDKPKVDDEEFDLITKKSEVTKFKRLDSDRRSESPWADEEEIVLSRTRRPYSVSIDSPNSPASSITEDEKEYRIWKKSIFLVFNRLCTHRNSSLFAKPITNEQAPGYHSVIKRPMDLSTIKRNLDNGSLRTTSEFQRDVMLMFQNAVMYNKIGSTVHNMAKEMQKEGLEQLQILVQAQTQEYPLRRETRTSEPSLKRKRGVEK